MNQNIDSFGFDQIQSPQYPFIHPPSQEISEEVFQAKGDLMKSIQPFLEKFNCIPFGEKPKILLQAWEKFFAIQHAQPEDSNELFQKLLEDLQIINKELAEYNNSPKIAASNSNQEKDKPPQDSDIRQLIREECCIEVCRKQKLNMEDTMLELHEVCRQKELYCMHNDEVKNVVEQPAECGTRIDKSLQNFRVIYKKSSISLKDTSQISLVHAISPILPAEEPEYSLSMGYKHLNTTSKMESDEIIKSGVEELVPIPRECEVTSKDKKECDVLICEDSSTFDVCNDHSEILSDSVDDDISSDDDAFEDIEYVEALLPDLELVSLEEENDVYQEEEEFNLEEIQDVILREKLLSINRLIANIESLNDNPTPDRVLKSSASIPIFEESDNSPSDNFSPEFETFSDHMKETRSGITTTHAHDSLPEYDSFCFEIEPDQERLTGVVKNDISDDSTNDLVLEEVDLFLASDNSIPLGIENFGYDSERDIRFLEELLIDDSIPFLDNEASDFDHHNNPSFLHPPPEPPDVEFFFESKPDVIVEEILDELNEDECFEPGSKIVVSTNIEDNDYFPFMFVIRTFLSYLIYPEVSLLLLSAGSEDTFLTRAFPFRAGGISLGWNFHEQKPSYNQNYNDNYYPHDSPSFLCYDNGGGSHETFQCQPMNQNIDSSGFDQIQTPQYPFIHPPSQKISKEVFQAKGDLMKSIQTFLEKFNCIAFGKKPKILLQAWEKFFAIQHAQPEDSNELFQKLLEDLHIINKKLQSITILQVGIDKPPQDSDIRQLVREDCCIEVCRKQKQNMEDMMLELLEVCRQKELYCMHNDVDDLIESALNSKLLSINLNSQRQDKEKQEVKNVVEQPAERGIRIDKSLNNFRVVHKKSSISLKNTSQISPVHAIAPNLPTEEPEYSLSMGYKHLNTNPEMKSDEIIKSGVEELVPIPRECEVTSEDKRECDVLVCEDSSTFYVCNDHSEILSDSIDDDISSDDDAFEDIEYVEASLPNSELVSLEEENDVYQEEEEFNLGEIQDVILHEKLLSINRLIANIESLNDNPTPDRVLKSFASIPIFEESDNSLSDNFSPEFDTFSDHTEETRSSITTTHAHDSLRECDSFCFEIEPDQERLTSVVKNDISDDSTNDLLLEEVDLFLASDNSIPSGIENLGYDSEGDIYFLEELLIDDFIPFPDNKASDFDHRNNPSFPRPPPKPPDVEFFFESKPDVIAKEISDELNEDECFDPGSKIDVSTNVEDDDYFPFMFVI
nr:hypothetical protein [Tanacetum cinerariifolium]